MDVELQYYYVNHECLVQILLCQLRMYS